MTAVETASLVDEQVVGGAILASGADTRSKHRILADLKRLEQEIKFLEDEMEEVENTQNISAISIELLKNVETIPDPLLATTKGPANPSWDRWFEGPQDSKGCRCWIL